MLEIGLNVLLTSTVLSFVLWLSKTNPILGGFIVSLPLSTLIVLAFSRMQNSQTGNTFLLAKSIFVAVPATLLFFIPFLFAEKLKIGFWQCYFIGLGLLVCSYYAHHWIMSQWTH